MLNKPFRPFAGNTVNLSVSASSQRVEIDNCDSIRIMNNGTATVWVDFGDGTVTAALASGMPVGPGVTEVVAFPAGGARLYVAVIAAGATGSIYFTPGEGI